MALRRAGAHRLLAVESAGRHPTADAGPVGQDPVAHRARLPGVEGRPRPGPFRRPQLSGLASSRHAHRPGPGILHTIAPCPKSPCAALTLYAVLRELQALLGVWPGACHTCGRPLGRWRPTSQGPTSRSRGTATATATATRLGLLRTVAYFTGRRTPCHLRKWHARELPWTGRS